MIRSIVHYKVLRSSLSTIPDVAALAIYPCNFVFIVHVIAMLPQPQL